MRGEDLYIRLPRLARLAVLMYARGDAELERAIHAALTSLAGDGSIRRAALEHGFKPRALQRHVRKVRELARRAQGEHRVRKAVLGGTGGGDKSEPGNKARNARCAR